MTVLASRGRDGAIAVRRLVNDNIAEVAERLDDRQRELLRFMCECGDLRCSQFVELTVEEYRDTVPGWIVGHDR